jgi:hypothetical protein
MEYCCGPYLTARSEIAHLITEAKSHSAVAQRLAQCKTVRVENSTDPHGSGVCENERLIRAPMETLQPGLERQYRPIRPKGGSTALRCHFWSVFK